MSLPPLRLAWASRAEDASIAARIRLEADARESPVPVPTVVARHPDAARLPSGAIQTGTSPGTCRRGSASRATLRSRRPRAIRRFPPAASRSTRRTGIRDVRSFSSRRRVASAPSMSGRRRSMRMTSGTCSIASTIPRRPSPPRRVSNPSARRTTRASFRLPSLSSTIRATGTGVSSGHADPGRPRRRSPDRPRGRPAAARHPARHRGRRGVRRPRLPAWRGGCQGPEVVVTDIRMPPDNTDEGIRAAERLRETPSRCRRRRAQPIRHAELRPRAAGERQRGSLVSPEGARPGRRASSCRPSGPSRKAAR